MRVNNSCALFEQENHEYSLGSFLESLMWMLVLIGSDKKEKVIVIFRYLSILEYNN